MSACAFIGYQPRKQPFRTAPNEFAWTCKRLKQRIHIEALRLTDEGVRIFISGMARGVETWAAEVVLEIRDSLPARKIQLWTALPYDRHTAMWTDADRSRYQRVLDEADRIIHVGYEYTSECLETRNRYMLEASTHLIAVHDGRSGAIQNIIDCARDKGLKVTIIDPL